MVSILAVGLSVRLLCPDFSDPSSLTERTSDSQRLGTSNDTTSVANWIEVLAIRWPVFCVDKFW